MNEKLDTRVTDETLRKMRDFLRGEGRHSVTLKYHEVVDVIRAVDELIEMRAVTVAEFESPHPEARAVGYLCPMCGGYARSREAIQHAPGCQASGIPEETAD